MKSLETNWRFRNKITTISDEYEFDICSYEKVGWSEIDASSVSSSNSLSLFNDRFSLRTRERICSRTWCKESDLWSILSFRGVASPLAVPPAGVCGVLLGGMGVFVPSPVPVNVVLFTIVVLLSKDILFFIDFLFYSICPKMFFYGERFYYSIYIFIYCVLPILSLAGLAGRSAPLISLTISSSCTLSRNPATPFLGTLYRSLLILLRLEGSFLRNWSIEPKSAMYKKPAISNSQVLFPCLYAVSNSILVRWSYCHQPVKIYLKVICSMLQWK